MSTVLSICLTAFVIDSLPRRALAAGAKGQIWPGVRDDLASNRSARGHGALLAVPWSLHATDQLAAAALTPRAENQPGTYDKTADAAHRCYSSSASQMQFNPGASAPTWTRTGSTHSVSARKVRCVLQRGAKQEARETQLPASCSSRGDAESGDGREAPRVRARSAESD